MTNRKGIELEVAVLAIVLAMSFALILYMVVCVAPYDEEFIEEGTITSIEEKHSWWSDTYVVTLDANITFRIGDTKGGDLLQVGDFVRVEGWTDGTTYKADSIDILYMMEEIE